MSRAEDDTRPSSPRGGRRAALTIERRVGTVGAGVGTARRAHAVRESLVVRLTSDELVGLGEASPLPAYSPESIDDAYAALRRADAEDLVREARSLATLDAYVVSLGIDSPSARFALETAALDFVGRMLEVPLHVLLSAGRDESFDSRAILLRSSTRPMLRLPLAALVAMRSIDAGVASARSLVEQGYRCLKAKVGSALDAELAVLRAIRGEVGPGIRLRLDANGALEESAVERAFAPFLELRPELVEEPCRLASLSSLPSTWSLPIALDESLTVLDGGRLDAFLGSGKVRALIAKPALLGGFSPVLALADRAAAYDVPVVVSHLFDGPIALAAASELALAMAVRSVDSNAARAEGPLAHGLAPHAGLEAHAGLASLGYAGREGASLTTHDRPGLALEASVEDGR